MIKVISFDIGGTILLNQEQDKYTLKELSELLELPYEKVKEAYKNIFQKEKAPIEELCNKFSKYLNIKSTIQILDFFKNKFINNDIEYIVNDEIHEVIKMIKQKNLKIILVSNSCCLIKNKLPKSILENIDEIFYSYDYGYTKEEQELYNIIIQKLNCKPNEILHIGDTLKSDYLYPIKYGLNALYYGNDIKEVTSIKSLKEIINYINVKE